MSGLRRADDGRGHGFLQCHPRECDLGARNSTRLSHSGDGVHDRVIEERPAERPSRQVHLPQDICEPEAVHEVVTVTWS